MNRTIISLAILKINWERARVDYIDNFIPFLGYLLHLKGYDSFDAESLGNLKNDFIEEYGLVIPNYALLTICNRAAKQKNKMLNRDSGMIYVDKTSVAQYDKSLKKKEVEEKFSFVINRIITFAKERYGIETTENEVADAIIVFLKHHDLDILFAAKDQSVLPKPKSEPKLKYVVSSFAIYAKDSEEEYFDALSDLAIGNALACSILYSNTTYYGRLKNLNIYLDTPLILTLIGLNGKFKAEAFEELLDILKADNANLKILDTTRGEVDSILNGSLSLLKKGKENIDLDKAPLMVHHCLNNNISASDLEMKILGLDSVLEKYRIEDSKVPDYMENKQHQIDDELLKQTIVDVYKTHKPDFILTSSKERTIDRDVEVLSGIYRFRQGNKPKTLKQCKDLFVTSNTSLAFASRIYEQKINNDPTVVPTCLTDVFVGTILWLNTPQKVKDLNEKKFIADCYAANQPSEALIKAYMAEVEKLKNNDQITLDDYYLLRSHQTALKLLEEKTMGDPDEITGETIGDIIFKIKADIRGQAEQDLQQEKSEHQRTRRELESQIVIIKDKEKKLEDTAEKFAKWISNGLWFLFFIVVLVVYCLTSIPNISIASYFLVFILIVQVALTVLNLTTGFNFWGLRNKLVNSIKKRILKLLQ